MPSARELGLITSEHSPGKLNAITDVPGVLVGHQTIRNGDINTGVTAILPHSGNLFLEKVPAAVAVINGFGKSVGLMQIEELGQLESPLLLTNTFAVGTCSNALIKRAVTRNPAIGRSTSTFSPVVCECNDGTLSDIQAMAVTEADAVAAIEAAKSGQVDQGAVGAGTGMRCFGFKGGVGTSSRQIKLAGKVHHLAILVNSNFGKLGQLILPQGWTAPEPVKLPGENAGSPEKGSIIIVMATDIPLDDRQLRRVARRCGAGLARLGSFWGHGSGDIVVAFSTASRLHHDERKDVIPSQMLNENRIDSLFAAATDCTAEAVLNSMLFAKSMTGRDGHNAVSLADVITKSARLQ